MRQIISGETPKKIVLDEKNIKEAFLLEKKSYYDLNEKDVIYNTKSIVNHTSYNFLNTIPENRLSEQIRYIIEKEFNICEKIFPFLGDLFLDLYFDLNSFSIKNNKTIITGKNYKNILNNLKFDTNKNIFKYIFENCSLEYNINVKTYKGEEVVLEKSNKNLFDVIFDNSYLGNKKSHKLTNYRFLIYDGYIQNVSEIHHLLEYASQSKESHVIFCFGISQEVKKTIIENNKRGNIELIPLSFEVNEENLNILNDIAALHSSDIVSTHNGNTISQVTRKGLPVGKEITIRKNSFSFQKICSENNLNSHKKFLIKRINDSTNLKNSEYLSKRLKRVNEKSINIFIPDVILKGKNSQMFREFEYCISLIKNIQKPFVKFKNKAEDKFYFIPFYCIQLIKEKILSFNNISKNIKCALIDANSNKKEKKCQ